MRRKSAYWFFAALLLATTSALALQGIGLRSGTPTAPPGYVGPGDAVTGAKSWYGLRAYSAAYATSNGKLIEIHRLSDDQQCDMLASVSGGFGRTGNCDQTASNGQSASTFCNATTCVVTTLYDQASNNHLGQSIVSSQPQLLFNCLGTLTCIKFAGVQQFIGANILNLPQPLSMVVAANYTGTAMGETLAASGNEIQLGFDAFSSDDIYATAGTLAHITGNATGIWHSVQLIANDPSSFLTIDGVPNAVSVGTNSFASKPILGAMVAQFVEAGIFSTALTAQQQTDMHNNMHNYWGSGL